MIGWARIGRSGSAAIEAAVALPFIAVLAAGLFEIAHMAAIDGVLAWAAREASRVGMTGAPAPAGTTREAWLSSIIEARALGLIDPAGLTVEMVTYGSFPAVRQPEPFVDLDGDRRWGPGEPYTDVNGNGSWDADQGRAGAGQGGEVVLYAIRYVDTPLTALTSALLSRDTLLYEARVAVRNEPFRGQ